jgi:signal transduction histidine kinase
MREMAGRRLSPHFTRSVSGMLASVALLIALVGVVVLALLLRSVGSGVTDPWSLVALVVVLVAVVVVAVLGARLRRAVLESGRLTEEQSALRRVATLVAQSVPASEVFEAVTHEVGLLCDADLARMERYEEDGTVTGVGAWARGSDQLAVGTRFQLSGLSVARDVRQTGAPVRLETFAGAYGDIAREAQELGIRSSVGCPIVVAGQLWGVIAASTTRDEPFPANTETQIGRFTQLVATAIANAEARQELQGFAEEQAALRRVATLVARAAAPEEVFAAVTSEVGRVLSADHASMARYDVGGTATVVGTWSEPGAETPFPIDLSLELGGWNTPTLVFETGLPARIDYDDASGVVGNAALERGIRSSVGAPISVEGRLWGLMGVLSTRETSLSADTEARLAGFTELVATAIANAEARAALTASRARIVTAADTTRRHIERDLHDGAQQRLVSLGLHLRGLVRVTPPPETGQLTAELDQVADGLTEVLDELREIARGIHPTALAEGGLRPALKGLARRSVVPVRLDVAFEERLPEPIELAAYYVVAEALTNTAKHADASVVDVRAVRDDDLLRVRVQDDGRGGAEIARGTGLVGLTDRVEALGGRLLLHSPPSAGTTMQVTLPLTAPGVPGSSAVVPGGRSG